MTQKENIKSKVDIRYYGMHILTNKDRITKSTIKYSLFYHGTKKYGSQFEEMKIQPKTKIFTWRVAKNILPTRTRLISKNVQVWNGCYLCGEIIEEVWHLFNSCQYFHIALGIFDL